MAATYLTTYTTSQDKREAEIALTRAARSLTVKGCGKTHFAKIVKVKGVYQVNIYKR